MGRGRREFHGTKKKGSGILPKIFLFGFEEMQTSIHIFRGFNTKIRLIQGIGVLLESIPASSYVHNWIVHLINAVYLDVKALVDECSHDEFGKMMRYMFNRAGDVRDNLVIRYLDSSKNRATDAYYSHCLLPILTEHIMNQFSQISDDNIQFVCRIYLHKKVLTVNKSDYSRKCANDIKDARDYVLSGGKTDTFLRWLLIYRNRFVQLPLSEMDLSNEIERCTKSCYPIGTYQLGKEYVELKNRGMGEFLEDFEVLRKHLAAMFFTYFIRKNIPAITITKFGTMTRKRKRTTKRCNLLESRRKRVKLY